MHDWPFYDELREGYETYRAEMHIPTALFEALLEGRISESLKEHCRAHLEVCTDCSRSFKCFKELMETGKISGIERIATPDEIRESGRRIAEAVRRRIRQREKPETTRPRYAEPYDVETAEAYGVEEYAGPGHGKVYGGGDTGTDEEDAQAKYDGADEPAQQADDETEPGRDEPPSAKSDEMKDNSPG